MDIKQRQQYLIDYGFLEGPADGRWGAKSEGALADFFAELGMPIPEPEKADKILASPIPKPELNLSSKLYHGLAGKCLKWMLHRDFKIFSGARHYNLIYVEGLNPDGTLNPDKSNEFNDLRLIVEVIFDTPHVIGRWSATTEPGKHYTIKPMNPKGAARIKFGQYKAWQIGVHGNSEPHEALVQTAGTVTVHRDLNKDFIRTNDKLDTGYFGINQHHGYDLAAGNIGRASAGCLVGRTRQGHREFMEILKSDRRYLSNKQYPFSTTIIPGNEL